MQNSYFISPRAGAALLLSISAAFVFFALQTEWIIWRGPAACTKQHAAVQTCKHLSLYYWQQKEMLQEVISQIWSDDDQLNLCYLLNTWLSLLQDEQCIKEHLSIESVLLSPRKQTAYISFNRKPFNKEQAIYEKLLFIDALCKTIRCVPEVKYIRLLVHHQPLFDPHLDFQVNWKIAQEHE